MAKAQKAAKYVYVFGNKKADGDGSMKPLLGGKGANLAEMCRIGLPVPPGFTITTEVCTYYYANKRTYPPTLRSEMESGVAALEQQTGKKFGDLKNPLLVSVRSGAKFSMPGMMDTILNLGLTDDSVEGLKRRTNNGRFAFDSYRRFIQMFEHELDAVKKARGAKLDTDLDEQALRDVVARYKKVVKSKAGRVFPQDPHE